MGVHHLWTLVFLSGLWQVLWSGEVVMEMEGMAEEKREEQ